MPTERNARRPIYLDHHATTPVDPRVAAVVLKAMTETFGNPNSADHRHGDEAATLVDDARGHVAALVGAAADDVRFTSGSSEALRLALAHAAERFPGAPLAVACSRAEHPALLEALAAAAENGWARTIWLDVDGDGRVGIGSIEAALAEGASLVCLMAANNEVGTLNDVGAAAALAGRHGADILVDGTQAAGRVPLQVHAWHIDYLVLSSHKLHGPKGAGALVAISAGGHGTRHRRGRHDGTPNTPAIAGMGEACRLALAEMADDATRIVTLRNRLQAHLLAGIDGLVVNGDQTARLPNNLHVSAPDAPNDMVVAHLRDEVSISTGAACASGADAPSHVLRAMGLPIWRQEGALRISLGRFTTEEEVDRAGKAIVAAVRSVRTALGATP